MGAVIEWTDDLPKKANRWGGEARQWQEEAVAELKSHPGKWGVVLHGEASGMAGSRRKLLVERGCEATVRRNGDGFDLYARWPEQ